MRRSPTRTVSNLLALMLCLAAPSWATTMRHLDTRALSLGSSDIVIGHIESVRPRWSADHRRIFSDVDVTISRTLKGGAAERITLTQLGGEIDGVKYAIPGGPLFRPGSDALLFVWRDSNGRPQVNALAQGKFDIEKDAATGKLMVQRNAPGFEVSNVKTLAGTRASTAPATRLSLDELIGEIQSALATGGGR